MLINGERTPKAGEIFKNPALAQTLRRVAQDGKDGFYRGPIADAIVGAIKSRGGLMDLEVRQEFVV